MENLVCATDTTTENIRAFVSYPHHRFKPQVGAMRGCGGTGRRGEGWTSHVEGSNPSNRILVGHFFVGQSLPLGGLDAGHKAIPVVNLAVIPSEIEFGDITVKMLFAYCVESAD